MEHSRITRESYVSVLVITRNTRDLLFGLLQSLYNDKDLVTQIKEIVIVDNGSTDGTGEAIETGFPQVTLIRNEANRGFAAAVNQAWRRAEGDFVLLLNSDTRVLPGELTRIFEFLHDNPAVGVVGPSLVYEDMAPQRSFAPIPSLTQEMAPRFVLELMNPERYGGKTWGSAGPEPVDSLIGAALVIRRSVLEAVDGFDERFFFFLEETDFCKRVRQHGWQVMYFPAAQIIHYQGKTVKANWVQGRIEYNISLDKFIRKNHGCAYHMIFRIIKASKALLALIGTTILSPLLIFSISARKRYVYHALLLWWYLRGCPERGGLQP